MSHGKAGRHQLFYLLCPLLWGALLPVLADPIIRDFQPIDYFPHEQEQSYEDKSGKWIYEALDNPAALENRLLRGAAYGALDLVGVADPIKAFVEEIGDATEFEFGACSQMKLRNSLTAETCLDGGASLELDADYDLQGLELKMHWRF